MVRMKGSRSTSRRAAPLAGGRDDEDTSVADRRRARALVVAAATSDAARDAWRRVVRDIDGGASATPVTRRCAPHGLV